MRLVLFLEQEMRGGGRRGGGEGGKMRRGEEKGKEKTEVAWY